MKESLSKFLMPILLMVACATHAQNVELEDIQGQQYQKNYPIGDGSSVTYNIPLPEGEWVVVRGNTYTTNNTAAKMKELFLATSDKQKLNAFMYIRAKVDGTSTRWLDEPCKGEDFLYRNDYGMKLWDQRCLTIRQSTFLQNSDNKVQQMAREFFAKQGIKYDVDAISVRFMTYTRGGKYLYVDIATFPSNYGLTAPTAASPVTSAWHRVNFGADPQKARYVKELAEWAEKYSEVIFKSFEQEKRQNVEIPAFGWKP